MENRSGTAAEDSRLQRRHAELLADRAGRADRDLAVAGYGRAGPARTIPDLVPTTLAAKHTAVGPEVAEQIDAPDHLWAAGAEFVIIGLLGRPMSELAPQSIQLSIVYEPVEQGWVQARIEGIPEVITAAPSKNEARLLVLDALREYLFSIRGNGDAADRELVDLLVPS